MDHSIKEIIQQVENKLAAILINIETLNDVQIILESVKDVDKNVLKEERQRLIRMINELLYYTIVDLKTKYEQVTKHVERLFYHIKYE